MNDYRKDKRIDEYILTLPEWQQSICQKVRDIVHNADKEVIEAIKRTNRPYFVLDGDICALLGTKTHVNIFIYDPTVSDPEGMINQGHNNKTAKAIQVFEGGNLNEKALLELFKEIITNNRAGGWRKLQKLAVMDKSKELK
jgi:hypothetical protein